MLVLALDTTSEKGGVAIYRDSECLATVANQGPANIYSITLFQMVAQALEQAGIRPSQTGREDGALGGLSDIDLFAVANGPGSFTGIRVGTAAVQAWARAFSRPVRGVSILEAMVEEARPDTQWAIPILDARRGEFFVGCFRRTERYRADPYTVRYREKQEVRQLRWLESDGLHRSPEIGPTDWQPENEGWVLRPGDLSDFLRARLVPFQPPPANFSGKAPPAEHAARPLAISQPQDQVGTALAEGASVTCLVRESDRAALALREVLPKSYRWQIVAGTLLKAIARLGLEAHRKGTTQDPADLHACYIRRPDAELNWRE